MTPQYGTLYAVGVGPGDPELLTLKATRALREADAVFTAASPKNTYSQALDIARAHLPENVAAERLEFPMTRDKDVLNAAWEKSAERVLEVLAEGKNAVFLTLGDPMTYSTFGYLMKTVLEKKSDTPIEIIPGITSYQAAAAASRKILVEGEESLAIVSGISSPDSLKTAIDACDNAVILKTYRKFESIRESLDDVNLKDKAVMVSRCGLSGQEIRQNIEDITEPPPYFSLIMLNKNR